MPQHRLFLFVFTAPCLLAQDALLADSPRAPLLVKESVHVVDIPLECVVEEVNRHVRLPSLRIWDETGDTINSRLYASGAIAALAKANWVILPHPEH